MRMMYVFVIMALVMALGMTYALASEDDDTVLLDDDTAFDDDTLDEGDEDAEGESGDDLEGVANGDDDGDGDHLKRAHNDSTDMGGCGYN